MIAQQLAKFLCLLSDLDISGTQIGANFATKIIGKCFKSIRGKQPFFMQHRVKKNRIKSTF